MAYFISFMATGYASSVGNDGASTYGYRKDAFGTLKPNKLWNKVVYELTFNTTTDAVVLSFGDAGGEQFQTADTIVLTRPNLPPLTLTWNGTVYTNTSAEWTDAAAAQDGKNFAVKATVNDPEPRPLNYNAGFSVFFGSPTTITEDPQGYTWNHFTAAELGVVENTVLDHAGNDTGLRVTCFGTGVWPIEETTFDDLSGNVASGLPLQAARGAIGTSSQATPEELQFRGLPAFTPVRMKVLTVRNAASTTSRSAQPDQHGEYSDGAFVEYPTVNSNGGATIPTDSDVQIINGVTDGSGNWAPKFVAGSGSNFGGVSMLRVEWDTSRIPYIEPPWIGEEIDTGLLSGWTADPTEVLQTGLMDFYWEMRYSGIVRWRPNSGAGSWSTLVADWRNGQLEDDFEYRVTDYHIPGQYLEGPLSGTVGSWVQFGFGINATPNDTAVVAPDVGCARDWAFTFEVRDVATQTVQLRKNHYYRIVRNG